MHGYIDISARQVDSKMLPPQDYLKLTLSGVSARAYDDTIAPIRMDLLRRLPSSQDFQFFPNIHGHLGVLEVKPVQIVYEAIDRPYNFTSTFPQHNFSFLLSSHVCIRPLPTIYPSDTPEADKHRAYSSCMDFVQFKHNSSTYQVIHLETTQAQLNFEVANHEDHEHINVESWRAFYHGSRVQLDSHTSIMNRPVFMHRLFDRVSEDSNMEVVNTFCPDYLEAYKLYEEEMLHLESDSEAEIGSDSESESVSEFDREIPDLLNSLFVPQDLLEAAVQAHDSQQAPVELPSDSPTDHTGN